MRMYSKCNVTNPNVHSASVYRQLKVHCRSQEQKIYKTEIETQAKFAELFVAQQFDQPQCVLIFVDDKCYR